MKVRKSIYLVSVIMSLSCKVSSLALLKEDKIIDCPCKTTDSKLNVRIKNTGVIPFTSISINIDNKDYKFGGLNPGEYSCYKNLPYIYKTVNKISISFFSLKNKGVSIITEPIDYVGEVKMTSGYVTINIPSNGTISKPQLGIIDIVSNN